MIYNQSYSNMTLISPILNSIIIIRKIVPKMCLKIANMIQKWSVKHLMSRWKIHEENLVWEGIQHKSMCLRILLIITFSVDSLSLCCNFFSKKVTWCTPNFSFLGCLEVLDLWLERQNINSIEWMASIKQKEGIFPV